MTLAIFKKDHCMVDIETMSTKQNGCIISIGACKFNFNDGISDEFSVNIDIKSSISYNLSIEKETVEWWATQPKEIRDAWNVDKQSLPNALMMFNDWIGNCKNTLMWANGSVFDFGLLRSSYEATKIKRPWEYWNEMDLRTVSTLLDFRLSKGNAHTALGDARNQTEQLIKMLKGE